MVLLENYNVGIPKLLNLNKLKATLQINSLQIVPPNKFFIKCYYLVPLI